MRRTSLLIGLSAALVTPSAAAVELSWTAPEGCPDRAAVEARIAKLLGTTTADDLVIAEGRVVRNDAGYHLSLTTTRKGTHGERALDDPSCTALADSAALIVAMAVDPAVGLDIGTGTEGAPAMPVAAMTATSGQPELAPAADEMVVAPPVDEGTPSVAPRIARAASPSRPGMLVAAGGDVLGGVFPRAAVGASASVGVRYDALRVEVGFRYAPPSEHALDAPAGASGTFGLWAVTARGALQWPVGAAAIGPAVGVEAGRARGRGHGVSTSLEGTTPWIAGSLGALGTLRTAHYGVSAELSAVVPVTRPSFVIEGEGTVHTPAPIGVRASVSAEVYF